MVRKLINHSSIITCIMLFLFTVTSFAVVAKMETGGGP